MAERLGRAQDIGKNMKRPSDAQPVSTRKPVTTRQPLDSGGSGGNSKNDQ